MSDLQCPARFVLVTSGTPAAAVTGALDGLPVRAVYCGTPDDLSTALAAAAGVRVCVEPGLADPAAAEVVAALADLHRGETVVVICPPVAIAVAAHRAGGVAPSRAGDAAPDGVPLVVEIDADGWVVAAR